VRLVAEECGEVLVGRQNVKHIEMELSIHLDEYFECEIFMATGKVNKEFVAAFAVCKVISE
jgi:hypothetical protein